ncbi:pilin subunit UpsB [Saccharolobus shibatae]|uniref:UV-induced pilin subunit n=2 Tax=Saccharolobus TaxID=2100760 RepID=A0A8F5BY28_9CREN|nr:archaellin/type IV pilin N-terminal domain-containing protein [Saccharolobus shibatae]QXJ33597.1 UV-induced pilin subunit [Saccharolobus shibatae]
MKAISSIFSTLIVVMITLSLIVPLYLFFAQSYINSSIQANSAYNNYLTDINVKISVIYLGNSANTTFVYNYGSIPIIIDKVIVNNVSYNVKYEILTGSLAPLSSIINSNIPVKENSTIILQINGNYYYFNLGSD